MSRDAAARVASSRRTRRRREPPSKPRKQTPNVANANATRRRRCGPNSSRPSANRSPRSSDRDSRTSARRKRATRLIPAPAPRPTTIGFVARLASLSPRASRSRWLHFARTSSDSPPRSRRRSPRSSPSKRPSPPPPPRRRFPRRRLALAVDPDVAEEMEKARAEASALRDALERKDEQLRSASAREATLAAARDALQSRVSDLAVELESASNGYDAEIARSPPSSRRCRRCSRNARRCSRRCKGVSTVRWRRNPTRETAKSRTRARRCVRCRRSWRRWRRTSPPRRISRRNSPPLEDASRTPNAPPPPTPRRRRRRRRFARHSPRRNRRTTPRARRLTRCGRHSPRRPNSRASRPETRGGEEKDAAAEPIAAEPNRRGDFVRVRVHRGGTGVVFVLVCSDRGRVDGVHGRGALGRDAHLASARSRERQARFSARGAHLRRDGGDARATR